MIKIANARAVLDSTVEHTNIYVDGGKIVAMGQHDELLQSSEIYKEVYDSQVKGGEE